MTAESPGKDIPPGRTGNHEEGRSGRWPKKDEMTVFDLVGLMGGERRRRGGDRGGGDASLYIRRPEMVPSQTSCPSHLCKQCVRRFQKWQACSGRNRGKCNDTASWFYPPYSKYLQQADLELIFSLYRHFYRGMILQAFLQALEACGYLGACHVFRP